MFYYSCLTLQKSVNRLIEMKHLFSTLSGIKMYFSKSEAMSATDTQIFTSSPLWMVFDGFRLLGYISNIPVWSDV